MIEGQTNAAEHWSSTHDEYCWDRIQPVGVRVVWRQATVSVFTTPQRRTSKTAMTAAREIQHSQ